MRLPAKMRLGRTFPFSNFLESAADRWKVAHGETLHQMAKFLFSNFTVKDRKVVNFALNPEIRDLFIPNFQDGGAVGNDWELKQLLNSDAKNIAERLLQLQNSLEFVLSALTKPTLQLCTLVM